MTEDRQAFAKAMLARVSLAILCTSFSVPASLTVRGAPTDTIAGDAPPDTVVVTDDRAVPGIPGCDAISIIDARTGNVIQRSPYSVSPGDLAATHSLSAIASLGSNGPAQVHLGLQVSQLPRTWRFGIAYHPGPWRDWRWLNGGAVAFTPDDRWLLVSNVDGFELRAVDQLQTEELGPVVREYRHASNIFPSAVEFSLDGQIIYVVGADGFVYAIDFATLTQLGAPLRYEPAATRVDYRIRRTFVTISNDGRYLVINGGDQNRGLNVIDTVAWTNVVVPLPDGSDSWELRFNRRADAQDVLVVHGGSQVALYRFAGQSPLELLASERMPNPWLFYSREPALLPLFPGPASAWTEDGAAIVAANYGEDGSKEWRVLDVEPGPPMRLRHRLYFDSCTYSGIGRGESTYPLSVLTLHDRRRPILTPTPTASATPLPVPTVSVEPTSSRTVVPSPTSSPSPFPPTAGPPPTHPPSPLYLPLALREHCNPAVTPVDIALVLDTSSSMAGAKLAAAKAAAHAFVAAMRLPRDRVAVVTFEGSARVVQPLTGDGAVLVLAIDGLATAPGTRIDRGIAAARGALAVATRAGAEAAIIVLTDGVQAEEPGLAVAEADAARAERVTVYAVGLGENIDRAQIVAIAGDEAHAHFAPTPGELARVYGELARVVPCPVGTYWGRR